jgi:hypothetical protein
MQRPRNRVRASTIAAPEPEILAGPHFAGLLVLGWHTTPRACGIRVRCHMGLATFWDEGISGNANGLPVNLFQGRDVSGTVS